MHIYNNTHMIFTPFLHIYLAQVIYEGEQDFVINKSSTYGQVIEDDLITNNVSHFYVHDINERLIRETVLKIAGEDFKASNAVSFLQFLKGSLKSDQTPAQTIGHFPTPKFSFLNSIQFDFGRQSSRRLCIESPPWIFSQDIEYERVVIVPKIEAFHYYPFMNKIKLILSYLTQPEGNIHINHGA